MSARDHRITLSLKVEKVGGAADQTEYETTHIVYANGEKRLALQEKAMELLAGLHGHDKAAIGK